ncbi:MAG: DUF488 family protein [Dysgonamonadaceae bacterium]|jgi:uncharacterized protein (DUF488 family)|nr:DUF488 family protein [Dysgonamonadaceae bacterium]
MFYYRRKLLLGLIQKLGGEVLSTPLQKNLFLLTRQQKEKSFDFIPYKYGCFSLQANNDLNVLEKMGYVKKRHNGTSTVWQLSSDDGFIDQLRAEDKAILNYIYNTFRIYNSNDLIKYTYVNYPFWAINSIILDDILGAEEKEKVLLQKRNISEKCLFTIGYEGKTLETYINLLIINNIKVLCDVRKNPLSKKWGFSKSLLKDACEKVDIKYVHIPQLGIESEERHNLKTFSDYKRLFETYEKTTLIANNSYLLSIIEILRENQRVALTCFEKDVSMCHRGVIAKNLMTLDALKDSKLNNL